MYRLHKLPECIVVALVAALGASATPIVNVGMKAAFSAGPYLLELLETAASENATSYFPLLDRIADGYFSPFTTEQELYNSFLDILRDDGHISSSQALSTFNLALSLRKAAPRVEAHYQFYTTSVEPFIEGRENCDNWVWLDGAQYCGPSLDGSPAAESLKLATGDLPFDRALGAGKDAILYADPTSKSFGAFHKTLSEVSKRSEIRYKLRYRRTDSTALDVLPVSGYGVELALKRTDYIVIDDREAVQHASQQPLKSSALDDEEEITDLKPLSTSELSELGLKAASFILKSDDPMTTLVKLTQDLPKFSTSIAAYEVSQLFLEEHKHNRAQVAPSGMNYLWMNGVQLIERQIEPFTLVDMVRRERNFLDGVLSLGFTGKQAISLLGHEEISLAKGNQGNHRFDWTDRTEEGRVIIWLNDLEKDERYASYPSTLKSLLQRTYPGQLPPIARNIFTLILPVDLSDPEDTIIVPQMLSLTQRGIPVRFGLVPLLSSNEASVQAKLAYYLVEEYGIDAFANYIKLIREDRKVEPRERLLLEATKDLDFQGDTTRKTYHEVLEAETYSQQLKLAEQWAVRLKANTAIRPVFADGVVVPREKNWMQTASMKLVEDLQSLQMGIYQGAITDDTWSVDSFLKGAPLRRNTYILPEDDNALRIIDVDKVYKGYPDLFGQVAVLESSKDSTKETWAAMSIIADLSTPDGQSLLLEALEFKRQNAGVRLEVVPNDGSGTSPDVNTVLRAKLDQLANAKAHSDLTAILDLANQSPDNDRYSRVLGQFLSDFGLELGTNILILNGRIIGPISPGDDFYADDFKQLLDFERVNRIYPVNAALENLELDGKLTGPISAAKVTSITALSTISDLPEGIFESAPTVRTNFYDKWEMEHTVIESGNPDTASVHIAGLLNPLSEQGQRWAPILEVLAKLDGVYLKLFINPKEKIEELPVKRFFRYVLDSKPSFDESGKLKILNATFKGLPSETLLTAGMTVPPAWLVAPAASVHDLDNIKLGSAKTDIEALYELEHILIEGHSREAKGLPPKGAQLALGTVSNPLLTDTIAMSNLGYFQFQANPGFYNITLKEGRSSDVYSIDSAGTKGWQAVPGDEGTEVAVMDFQGTTLYPRLTRNPGMEEVDVLEVEDGTADNIVSKGLKFAGNLFGGSKTNSDIATKKHAEINIFSVASGHLYERMLNIMIVSVMRNTKHTVKFWFIEQFLSPSFKDFIPYMAEEYGFQYEMVTYKWPHWLRQQKEKQREIWGYKILFLDVLFPLSLDKVIFVDADQIVRTDMIDLVNHDLEGAPYGFTPMCDSRTEMEGFRFWKQGYWASHLRGRPYHISALYVVDLRRFRQLAAGDRLRQQYHTLSADPNSLSNLDQDLPNNMQHQIPIHSLPQEWLWCETWCSDDGLTSARTIDLCNNPQTKEPKLDRARRQVPEWTIYDDEIAALDKRRKGTAQEQAEKDKVGGANTKSRRFEEPMHAKDEL